MLQLQLVTVNLAFVVDAAYDDDDERTGMKPLRPPRRCPLGSPWAHRAPRGTLRPPCIRDGDEAGSIGEVEVSASRRDVDLVARNEKLPMAGHLSHTQLLPFRETQCPNTCQPEIQLASITCLSTFTRPSRAKMMLERIPAYFQDLILRTGVSCVPQAKRANAPSLSGPDYGRHKAIPSDDAGVGGLFVNEVPHLPGWLASLLNSKAASRSVYYLY